MHKTVPRLPNPTSACDPQWLVFHQYLYKEGIVESNDPALIAYQNSCSDGYLSAHELNHCLTLRYFSQTNEYARLCESQFGTDENNFNPQKSIDCLDAIFSSNSYRFTDSVVFKGIGSSPYYEVLKIPSLKTGDLITFPGFLSTSVCRENAESFSRGEERILLIISGIDCVNAIVPPNKTVLHSPTSNIPEQEVLLNRGTTFEILDIVNEATYTIVSMQAK